MRITLELPKDETRIQVDDFLKEHEVYDFTMEDFKEDCEALRQVWAKGLGIESAPVRSSWRSNMPSG